MKLKSLDDETIDVDATRERIKSLETEISEEIGATWSQHFQEEYEDEENLVDTDIDVMYGNFLKIVKKQRLSAKTEEKYAKVGHVFILSVADRRTDQYATDGPANEPTNEQMLGLIYNLCYLSVPRSLDKLRLPIQNR